MAREMNAALLLPPLKQVDKRLPSPTLLLRGLRFTATDSHTSSQL
jgi:hypothetical protein